jgi:hypothetical protein
MTTRSVVLISIFFVISINQLKSQDFEVPKNYVLSSNADYQKYETEIIACANWLENFPLDKDEMKRKEANAFLMQWLTGTPNVSINLNADLVSKYTEKNPQLLMIFMAGWTRYSLENNYSKDQQKGYYEGYKSMINVYKKGIGISKDKNMGKLVEVYDKGELENWVKEK